MHQTPQTLLVIPANNTTMQGELVAFCPQLEPMAVARVKRPPRTLLLEDLPAYRESTLDSVTPFSGQTFELVVYGCTAAGFLAGPHGNEDMVATLRDRTGARVVSTADAMVSVLREESVSETAVVTPYLAPVNDGLRAYLEASGIAVETLASFLCKTTDELGRITEQHIFDLAMKTVTPHSKALFIACSQLPTAGIIGALRDHLGIPVWSSIQSTAWAAARALAAEGKNLSFSPTPLHTELTLSHD